MGSAGIREAYETGRGRVVVRARAHTEPLKQGKTAIIVTELPYQVNKAQLIEKIAELVREKKISEISDLRDESDRSGMRVVIELKREAVPKVVLNKLYKHTAMQSTFGVNMLALVDGVPRTLSLREMLRHYIAHQKDVIVRRTRFELDKAKKRAHILEGLLIAIANLDEVIRIIRSSEDTEAAKIGPHGALRPQRGAGPGHRRPAPAQPHRPRAAQDRGGAPRPAGAHRLPGEPAGQRGHDLRRHQRRAARDQADVRRRPPHRDRCPPRTRSTSRT